VLAFLERNVYSGSAINWPAVQCLTADICYGGSSATAATDRRVTAAFAEAWLTLSLGASQSFCFNLKSAVTPPAVSAKLSVSNAQQQQPQLQQQQRRETGATAAALAVINKSSNKGKGASSGAAATATAAAKHRYTAPAHTELAEVVQFINALPESDAPAILGLHSATCAAAVTTAGHTLWCSVIAATSSSASISSASSISSMSSATAATQRCVELVTLLSDMLADAGYAALHEGTVSAALVTPMEAFIQCEGVLLYEQMTAAAAAVDVLQQALSGQVSCCIAYTA
jgi:hypothetical protein